MLLDKLGEYGTLEANHKESERQLAVKIWQSVLALLLGQLLETRSYWCLGAGVKIM
jgi:hypothetical protein